MRIVRYELWENVPGTAHTRPYLLHYIPDKPRTTGSILILPGSGYRISPSLGPQEGDRAARYLCEKGIQVFILEYRVFPDCYPLPILDGRRAMRYIRYRSGEFGTDRAKVAVMGYSSGGHLAASLSSYREKIDYEDSDRIDRESYVPDLQILCYPVISLDPENTYTHAGSVKHLLAERYRELKDRLSPEKSEEEEMPPAFIWHNFDDSSVSVINSFRYAESLLKKKIPVEMHIFPKGGHGIGFPEDTGKDKSHDRQWMDLLLKWLAYQNFWEGTKEI